MFLPTLLIALSPVQEPREPVSPWAESGIEVYSRDGFEWSHSLERDLFFEEGLHLAVPTTSRSAIVTCAKRTAQGCAVRFYGGTRGIDGIGDLRFLAVKHREDQRIGHLVSGEPVLVGPPRLQRRFHAGRGDVAHVAYLDGVEAADFPYAFAEHPKGDTNWAWVVANRTGAEVTPAKRLVTGPKSLISRPFRSSDQSVGDWPKLQSTCDQVYMAATAPCTKGQPLAILQRRLGPASVSAESTTWSASAVVPALEWRGEPRDFASEDRLDPGEMLEIWFEAPPEAAEGESWTVLVEASDYKNPGWTARIRSEFAGGDHQPAAPPTTLEPGFLIEQAFEYVHLEGPDLQLDIRPTMGPGAAWGDVNGDGWVDLYVVQGAARPETDPLPNRLFLNRQGRLEDATEGSGAGHTGAGMGALFFDADGDGDLDLYVANYGPDAMFLNDGTGKFADVSEAVGVGGDLWSASVCAADYDKDGDLDLYVTSYLDYDPAKMPPAEDLGRYQREDPVEMLPFAFPGQRNTFLRNDTARAPAEGEPSFRFTDVTKELGLLDEQGRGMQAVFWDFDSDGDEDLYVANDVSFNVLFRNEGDGTFKDISFSTGLDDPRGGMGLAVGDADLDGDEDLFLTNWELDANALYVNNAKAPNSSKTRRSTFRDGTVRAGLGPASIGATSWGAVFFDAENDGDLDLFVANGYTSPDYESTGICVGQPNLFFENQGGGRFREATAEAGRALLVELASRSASACDYDRDGRVDLFVTANNGRAQLLSNQRSGTGHWVGVRLRGTGGNTHAIGAVVTVHAGETELTRSLRAGTGYLSGNPPELHFGLDDAKGIDRIVVHWPSGRTTEHSVDAVDTWVTLLEE